jgi:SAM-dependent methyltransferase
MLLPTKCAICGTKGNATEVYPARLGEEKIDEKTFSARRFYGKINHFRIVRCDTCGLLRSDPIIDASLVGKLYEGSSLTYENHIPNLRETYGRYLRRAVKFLPSKERLLEIGAGNGFFLEEASEQGFAEVWGVEPSIEAIEKAAPRVKKNMKLGMFSAAMFPEDHFDIICIFQTLEHFIDPAAVLSDCRKLLKPGGVVLAINHDLESLPVKILGEKSPVVDIEHMYLYSVRTMEKQFEKCGLRPVDTFAVWNRHSFGYLLTLVPLPKALKDVFLKTANALGLAKLPLLLPIGNVGVIGQK